MRTELDTYKENQVYLRPDGKFIWLISVDPISKIKSKEKDRTAYFRLGNVKQKGDEFNDDLIIIENSPTDSVIAFEKTKNYSINLDNFRKLSPVYIGTITENKLKDISRRM